MLTLLVPGIICHHPVKTWTGEWPLWSIEGWGLNYFIIITIITPSGCDLEGTGGSHCYIIIIWSREEKTERQRVTGHCLLGLRSTGIRAECSQCRWLLGKCQCLSQFSNFSRDHGSWVRYALDALNVGKNKDTERTYLSENVVNYHFIRSQGQVRGQSHGDTIYLLFDHRREFV